MFKVFIITMISALSFSVVANDIRIELDGTNRIDSWTKRGNMLLEGAASDEKTYQVRLSCISADRNSAGIAVGEIHIYKGPSHIGSKATLDYDQCLSLYDGLKELRYKLTMDWEKESYDANPTGKATFSILDL